jgi:hypothetical protein
MGESKQEEGGIRIPRAGLGHSYPFFHPKGDHLGTGARPAAIGRDPEAGRRAGSGRVTSHLRSAAAVHTIQSSRACHCQPRPPVPTPRINTRRDPPSSLPFVPHTHSNGHAGSAEQTRLQGNLGGGVGEISGSPGFLSCNNPVLCPPLVRPYSQPFSRTFYSKRGVLPEQSVSLSRKRHLLAHSSSGGGRKRNHGALV